MATTEVLEMCRYIQLIGMHMLWAIPLVICIIVISHGSMENSRNTYQIEDPGIHNNFNERPVQTNEDEEVRDTSEVGNSWTKEEIQEIEDEWDEWERKNARDSDSWETDVLTDANVPTTPEVNYKKGPRYIPRMEQYRRAMWYFQEKIWEHEYQMQQLKNQELIYEITLEELAKEPKLFETYILVIEN
jgi:hypothetical protein